MVSTVVGFDPGSPPSPHDGRPLGILVQEEVGIENEWKDRIIKK